MNFRRTAFHTKVSVGASPECRTCRRAQRTVAPTPLMRTWHCGSYHASRRGSLVAHQRAQHAVVSESRAPGLSWVSAMMMLLRRLRQLIAWRTPSSGE